MHTFAVWCGFLGAWLLPPVAWVKARRHRRRERGAVLASMPAELVAEVRAFFSRATAWAYVTVGATLIALRETWELVVHLGWPPATLFALAVPVLVLCIATTAVRVRHGRREAA